VISAVASDATKIYHNVIKCVDTAWKETEDDAHTAKRIELREKVAECFFLNGQYGDAQLYLIGAMQIAHWYADGKDLPLIKQRLERAFARVREAISPAKGDAPQKEVGKPARQPRSAKADGSKESRADPSLWIALHTARADGAVVTYCAAHEEILAATNKATKKYVQGVALAAVAVAAPAIGMGGAAAVALTYTLAALAAHPLVLVTGLVCAASAAYAGVDIARKGNKLMQEPAIRTNLNTMMSEAMALFSQGNTREFLSRLSQPFGETVKSATGVKPVRLLEFPPQPNALFTVDPKRIEECLREHGFRPDGIAYILSNIAEALSGGGDAFEPDSGNHADHLRGQARVIFSFIIDDSNLRNSAYELDNKIIAHSFSSRWSQYFGKSADGKMINDIPASYYAAEEAAPFSARLEEMRNCARVNYAILDLIIGTDLSTRHAAVLLKQLQQSPNSQFQYFSVSAHRLNTIEDVISAFGVPIDDAATPQAAGPATPRQATVASVGANRCAVIHTNVLTRDQDSTPLYDLLGKLKLPSVSAQFFVNRLGQYINHERTTRTRPCGNGSVLAYTEVPIGAVASHAVRISSLAPDAALRAFTVAQLHEEYFELIHFLYGVRVIRCRLSVDGKEYMPLDDVRRAEASLKSTLFLHASAYRAMRRRNAAPVLPTFAFTVDGDTVVVEKTSELAASLLQVQNLKHEHDTSCSEVEKTHTLYLIHRCYQDALRKVHELPGMVHASTYVTAETASNPEVVEAFLGLVECRVAMFKLKDALTLLQSVRTFAPFTSHWKFWYLLAVVTRKQCDYRTAKVYINRAAEALASVDAAVEGREEWYHVIVRERAMHQSLRQSQLTASDNILSNVKARFHYTLPQNAARNESAYYNVLCLDGGGIKGIIPAMILAEIEKRAKVPISHMFDHIAGTSTGAILGAGLTIPHPDRPLHPKYTAYDILELYADPKKAEQIFARAPNFLGLWDARFVAGGRGRVVEEYYGNTTLSGALTELSIVACNQTEGKVVVEFNKSDHAAVSLVHAVMASSAAPTFFPAHIIGPTEYIDGGLVCNNPSRLAYESALKRASKPIRMWSLGCGDVMEDFEAHGHGLLHWAPAATAQAMRGQQHAADKHMATELGSNYTRWNLLFETHHELDDIRPDTMKEYVELAKQFIAEHDDQINHMVQELTEVWSAWCVP
jgi:hypothetical protein